MVKKLFFIFMSVIMSIMLFAVDMKTDNMDTPDIKSNWYNPDVIIDGPLSVPITLLSEDFEGGTMPAGWQIVSGSGVISWAVVSSSSSMYPPNYGTYFACIDPYNVSYITATKEDLYSPAVNTSVIDSLYLSYDYSMQDYAGNGDFNVYIITFLSGVRDSSLLVNITIDQVGTETLDCSSYLPADSVKMLFSYTMSSSTAWGLAIDNVEIIASIVPLYDAVLTGITNPASSVVLPPAPFNPGVNIANGGQNVYYNVYVYCLIDDTLGNVFTDTVIIDTLLVDDTLNISFDTFTPQYLMDYNMTMYCEASPDSYSFNDTLDMEFRTYDIDVGIIDINPTTTTYTYGTVLPLWATYVNHATQATSFTAKCDIYDDGGTLIYNDELYISSISPAETLTVEFSYFTDILPTGDYNAQFFCDVNHDINTGNNFAQSLFTIDPIAYPWEDITGTALLPAQWPGVCQDESSIWLIGGLASSVGQTYVQRYDTINGWTYETDLPLALFGQACAIIDSKLYVIGGCDAGFMTYDSVFIYDLAAKTWSSGTPYPERLGGMAGGVYNGKMYLVGGLIDGSFNTTTPTYCYDPSADTAGGTPWDTMAICIRGYSSDGLQLGTNFFGNPASVNTPIIVGGDYQGIHTYYRYEPLADTAGGTPWTDITHYAYGSIGTKASMITWDNDYAYIVGGDVYGGWGGYYPGWTYSYNFTSGTWSDMGVTQYTGLEGSGGGILGDYIYSAGGTIGSSAINPAPFERTYREGKAPPVQSFDITHTYPINRQLNAPVDEAIIVAFSQPVDTNYGFSYTVSPDPGLLSAVWAMDFDTLYIYHEILDVDETYYVEITEAYNDSGMALQAGNIPNPFGFNTGITGINENNMYVFSLTSKHNIGSSAVTFDYILPSNGDVIIDIYNITGSKVKSLTMKEQTSGVHSVNWNAGKEVSSGIYLYRAHYGDNVITGRMEIIK